MATILKLKSNSYFMSLLKAFSNKTHITFEIDAYMIRLSSLEAPFVYLSLERDFFEILNEEEVEIKEEFTIRAEDLIKNFNLINNALIMLDSSFKIISPPKEQDINFSDFKNRDKVSYIEIPYINPIKSHYQTVSKFPTRVIIEKECLKNFIRGKVTYQCDKNRLIVKKKSFEIEEVLEIEAEFIEMGYLEFYCSNHWVDTALLFYEIISSVILCFSDDLLCIKFFMKDNKSAYLEIQNRVIQNYV